jgi:hypothetical protein
MDPGTERLLAARRRKRPRGPLFRPRNDDLDLIIAGDAK